MTPREIELLTIAKLEHDGHQLNPEELREVQRQIVEGRTAAIRYLEMMNEPAYQWNKPSPRR
ncbi:hypothetical protein [Citrobacter freundii]|uniref:hypothetical protein n=1 Tax=Citrobacter freundii TaxID=546 RepID=UPI003B2458C6